MSSTDSTRRPDEGLARQMRSTARNIFLSALEESSIAKAFDRHVHFDRGVLRIGEDLFDLKRYTRVFVLSIGKAAYSMVEALHAQVGQGISGIAVGATEPGSKLPGFQYFHGGHPVPNQDSLLAGDAILKAFRQCTASSLVIFMISGGGSAVVEKPIASSISLDDLTGTYKALVLSGGDITEINAIRKHLSAIKGGRLARAAGAAQQVSILISDVPDDAEDALASGPTMPDSTTVEDCYRLAEKYKLLPQFPDSVRRLFEEHVLEETPKAGDEAFARSRWWTILSNSRALQAAAAAAARAGFAVEVDNRCNEWEYREAADYLLKRVRELRQGVARVCLISGGEVTVRVSGGGVGGRNQQFAVYCAGRIAGENFTVLSAGTDGIDGNSPAAGAVVDGTTVERAQRLGLDPAALARFDTFPLVEALGDAVITGPTGTNVRDVRVLLAY